MFHSFLIFIYLSLISVYSDEKLSVIYSYVYIHTSGLTREIHGPSVFIPCACSNCVSKACI